MDGQSEPSEEWTLDSLRTYLAHRIDQLAHLHATEVSQLRREIRHRSHDIRRENDDRDRLLVQIMDERQSHNEREFDRYVRDMQTAITKAEDANQRRFESVNEFRAQLNDQQARFFTRQEFDAAHEALMERVSSLQDRMNRSEGKGVGLNAGWLYLMGGASFLVTILTLVTLLMHLRSGG